MLKRESESKPPVSTGLEVFTPDEVAVMLKCSVSSVRNLIFTGKLRAVQISIGEKKHYRIPSKYLEAYLSTPEEPLYPATVKETKAESPKLSVTRHLRLK